MKNMEKKKKKLVSFPSIRKQYFVICMDPHYHNKLIQCDKIILFSHTWR